MNSRKLILDKINSKINRKPKKIDFEAKIKNTIFNYVSEAEIMMGNNMPSMADKCLTVIVDLIKSHDPQATIDVVTVNKILNLPETIKIVWSDSFSNSNNLAKEMTISTMDNLFS